MRIAVIANGEWDYEWGVRELADFDCLIAVDGGGNNVLKSGYIPHALIGDLDSIQPENLEKCRCNQTKILQYPREKDETDLELALDYAMAQSGIKGNNPLVHSHEMVQDIWLFGATGGRVDHLLGNIGLLLNFYKRGLRIRVKDPLHELWLVKGKQSFKGNKGQELSLVPVTEYAVVRTEGLFYPLNNDTLRQDLTRGISNVFLGEDALIEVSEGIVLAVLLNPQKRR